MALGDVFQVRMFGLASDQQWNNIYHFVHIGIGGGNPAEDLDSEIVASLVPTVRDQMGIQASILGTETVNLANPLEYYLNNFVAPIFGVQFGELSPSFVAATIFAPHTLPQQRNAYKRYAGIPEGSVNGNQLTAGHIVLLGNICDVLNAPLPGAQGGIWQSALVKRPIVYGINPVVIRSLNNWRARSSVTTQASRRLTSPP